MTYEPHDEADRCMRSGCYATRHISDAGYCPLHENDRGLKLERRSTGASVAMADMATVTAFLETQNRPQDWRLLVWSKNAWREEKPKRPFSIRRWIGEVALWWWKKRAGVVRQESMAVPDGAREKLPAPIDLVAMFYLGGPTPWTIVFDGDAVHWKVLRLNNSPEHCAIKFESVHKALLDVYEPNGRADWSELPLTLQRYILWRLETETPNRAPRRA